jgi:hypothetical protein
MLVSFAVENFASIKERIELSFVPSAFYKELPETLIDCGSVPGGKLLPTALIYGPNASGKSNLIGGLEFLRSAVQRSHERGPEDKVPVAPFKLSPACADLPISMEIAFELDGALYRYGFKATEAAYVEEWLYSQPKGRRQILFEREGQQVRFGRSLKGQNRVIAGLMRENSLFLSVAAQNDHEQLTKIYHYFSTFETNPDRGPLRFTFDDQEIDPRIEEFLARVGTGVVGIRRDKIDAEKNAEFTKAMHAVVSQYLGREIGEIVATKYALQFAHRGENGEPVYFPVFNESAGTQRLLGLLAGAFAAMDHGSVLVVDELDDSLHTQVAEALLGLFASKAINKRGAQFLATTHDTNLMSSKHLRRDQIWFIEKDGFGASHLYPLSDIRTRNTDNIQRGYLQGRYGAIPFSGNLTNLIAGVE